MPTLYSYHYGSITVVTPVLRIIITTMAKQPPVTLGTEYRLPDGAVLHCRKPTNGMRRVLVEQPETNLRFLMEILAAGCLVKMELPVGYNDELTEVSVEDFEMQEIKADVWKRLDKLSLLDQQAFMEAFQDNNMPTKAMIDSVITAVKSGKK